MSFILPANWQSHPISSSRKSWIRENFTSKTVNGYNLGEAEEAHVEAHIHVREQLLQREIYKGMIQPGDQDAIVHFRIELGAKVARYTNPRTGEEEVIHLDEIEEMPLQEAIASYYEISGGDKLDIGALTAPHSKGNAHGKKPLEKSTKALNKLDTKTFTDSFSRILPEALAKYSDQTHRAAITKRVLFADFFTDRLIKRLEEKIKGKKQEAKERPLNPQALSVLRNEIQQLQALEREILEIDHYALGMALTHLPLDKRPSAGMLDDIGKILGEKIKNDLKGWFKKSINAKEAEYINDVVGMLHTDRASYFSFCDRHNLRKKRETAADVVLREAFAFIRTQEYDAEGFKKSSLLNGMSDALREEVQDIFGECGALANGAVPKTIAPDQFAGDMADKGLVDQMKTDVAEMRSRVNRDITMDQVPPPAERESNASSMALTAAAGSLGTAAAMAAGAYSGIVDAGTAWGLAHYVRHNPARVIAAIGAVDSLRVCLQEYLVPRTRMPNGGVRRELHMKRVAALGSLVLMGAYAALYTQTGAGLTDAAAYYGAQAVNWAFGAHLLIALPVLGVTKAVVSRVPGGVGALASAGVDGLTSAAQMQFLQGRSISEVGKYLAQREVMSLVIGKGLQRAARYGGMHLPSRETNLEKLFRRMHDHIRPERIRRDNRIRREFHYGNAAQLAFITMLAVAALYYQSVVYDYAVSGRATADVGHFGKILTDPQMFMGYAAMLAALFQQTVGGMFAGNWQASAATATPFYPTCGPETAASFSEQCPVPQLLQ